MPWADETGRAAKATKAATHYRAGNKNQRCDLCTMFRAPNRCTAVAGDIRPAGLCDLFERSHEYAEGGSVNYSGGSDISNDEGKVFSAGPYGRHRLDLTIPLARDTELTGQLSAAPNYYGQGRNDVGARVGIRKRFAGGGAVGYQGTSNPLQPFTVPLDAVKKLGDGDIGRGHATLADMFGFHTMASRIGDIPADAVNAAGGRQVLNKFVARIRGQNKSIPGNTLVLNGNRAGVAINVNRK